MPPVPSPDRCPALHTLADRLRAAGVPQDWALPAAAGYLALLRAHCARSCTDLMGSAEDVEKAASWCGPAGALAAALLASGHFRTSRGVMVFVAAVPDLAEYQRKAWLRRDHDAYETARRRSKRADPTDCDPLPPEPELDLFGTPVEIEADDPPPARSTVPGHQEATAYWCQQWEQHHGLRYPFTGRDAKCIQQLLKACGSVAAAAAAIDRYLRDRDPFVSGHPLHLLAASLARYVASDNGRGMPTAVAKPVPRAQPADPGDARW